MLSLCATTARRATRYDERLRFYGAKADKAEDQAGQRYRCIVFRAAMGANCDAARQADMRDALCHRHELYDDA